MSQPRIRCMQSNRDARFQMMNQRACWCYQGVSYCNYPRIFSNDGVQKLQINGHANIWAETMVVGHKGPDIAFHHRWLHLHARGLAIIWLSSQFNCRLTVKPKTFHAWHLKTNVCQHAYLNGECRKQRSNHSWRYLQESLLFFLSHQGGQTVWGYQCCPKKTSMDSLGTPPSDCPHTAWNLFARFCLDAFAHVFFHMFLSCGPHHDIDSVGCQW